MNDRDLVSRLEGLWQGIVGVVDGKVITATINSACMKAEPRTGHMDDRATDHAKAKTPEAEGGTPQEHAQEQGWDCFKEKR